MEYVRSQVTGVVAGFGRKHLLTVVKFRLHDLRTVVQHWHAPIAAHVHDHLVPGVDRLTDRAIEMQPRLAPEDWDGSNALTPQGMSVDEFEDGVLLIPALPSATAEEYFLNWEQAAVLKHYLAGVRAELPQALPPSAGGIQAPWKKNGGSAPG